MKKKNKWIRFGRVLIVIFSLILMINSFVLFREIKRDVNYNNRCYGLYYLNDCYDRGEYYKIYEYTLKNKYVSERPTVDVSQYEAFGRYYHYYLLARMYPENKEYRTKLQIEKNNISFKKILNTISIMEKELEN